MTRRRLKVLWTINLLVLIGLVVLMWWHYQEVAPRPAPPAAPDPAPPATPAEPVAVSTATVDVSTTPTTTPAAAEPAPAAPEAPEASSTAAKRRVVFTYRDNRCKTAAVTAAFTTWKPAPMSEGPKGVWTYAVDLAPGDYSYAFVVDGRTYRDPSNPRTDAERRSLKTVAP
jgi:cytoskeletal protein RodZ